MADVAGRPHVRLVQPCKDERTIDMALIPDPAAFKKSSACLPTASFEPGETVLAAGSTTGQLFILRQGMVEVVRDGLQIATVSEPGAVFGELALLLDKPHTAGVRALEWSEFHVANASSLLTENAAALLYVSAVLAQRLDAANKLIVEIKADLDKLPGNAPGYRQGNHQAGGTSNPGGRRRRRRATIISSDLARRRTESEGEKIFAVLSLVTCLYCGGHDRGCCHALQCGDHGRGRQKIR